MDAAGNDTATYTTSDSGVTVDLSTAAPLALNLLNTGISLSVVEAVTGHGGHAEGDILIWDYQSNRLEFRGCLDWQWP